MTIRLPLLLDVNRNSKIPRAAYVLTRGVRDYSFALWTFYMKIFYFLDHRP